MAAEALPAASISKWTGLFRSVDPFAISPGAMERADNVVVPGPSLLRPRRGFAGYGTGVEAAATLASYGGSVVYYDERGAALKNFNPATLGFGVNARELSTFVLGPPVLSAYGTGSTTTSPVRFLQANGNLYFSMAYGLGVIYSPAGQWRPAGLQRPTDENINLNDYVAGTAFADKTQISYRRAVVFTDPNGNDHISPVSQRTFAFNDAGTTKAYTARASAGPMTPVGSRVRIFRTDTTAATGFVPDVAGDEQFEIIDLPLSSSGNDNGYIKSGFPSALSYTDNTPDVPWLVDPLYTNPTTGDVNGLGLGNSNVAPPLCADLFQFKSRTYFANTEEVHRLTVRVIGTGTGGIQVGDTFTIDSVTFKFVDGPGTPLLSGGFWLIPLCATGLVQDQGTVEKNIAQTGRYVATAINQAGSVSAGGAPADMAFRFVGAYVSAPTGLPGEVLVERLVPGCPAFTMAPGVGSGRGWATSLANNTSDSNRQPANLMQSQPNDPESVPPAFTNVVGRAEAPILRGIGLRDAAYLFKGGGDGLWKFTDDGTGVLQINPVDQTVNLVAPETVVALDNTLFCLSDKGVLRIADGGAPENISGGKIEDDLTALIRYVGPSTLARLAFGVAYESEKLYVLALPEAPNATTCTIQYVYSLHTDAWTRWTVPALRSGIVGPNDLLYVGRDTFTAGGNILWAERKTMTDDDQQDPGFAGVVPGAGTYSASALVFSGDVSASYAPGDLIQYSPDVDHSYLLRVITVAWDVGSNQTTVTLDQSATWTAGGSFSVLKGIQAQLELLPLTAGEPLYEKQWQNLYLYFRRATFDSAAVSYSSEKQQAPGTYSLAGPTDAPFLWSESLGFGLEAWGGTGNNAILKLALDQAAARSAELTLGFRFGDALASWELSALRIPYDPTTMRAVR